MTEENKINQALPSAKQASALPGFLLNVTRSNISPLTLNYLFQNIRNYTLSATVMVAGIWLFTRGENILGMPYLNWIFGIHVTLCGLVLTGLNFLHSLHTITQSRGNKWPVFIIFFTLLIGSLELVGVALWKFSV